METIQKLIGDLELLLSEADGKLAELKERLTTIEQVQLPLSKPTREVVPEPEPEILPDSVPEIPENAFQEQTLSTLASESLEETVQEKMVSTRPSEAIHVSETETRAESRPGNLLSSADKTTLGEQFEQSRNERLLYHTYEQRRFSDISKALSLNDRFLYQRELFGNDAACMQETLEVLNTIHSLSEALNYLQSRYTWDDDQESVQQFYQMVEQHFS